MKHLTYVQCCDDPHIFGEWFGKPSWSTWRVIDKAIFGLPLDDDEAGIFHQLTGCHDAPTEPCTEAWLIFGRRGGKDVKAASYASYQATIGAEMNGYRDCLTRGEKGVVQVLAVDRDQAGVCFGYIKAMFEKPMLAKLVTRVTSDSIELNNQISIEVTTNDKRRVRGRTVVCAILDEVAHWRSESAANPDEEVYQAITPAMATIPNALLIGISSPYSRKGLLWRKHEAHWGQPGRVLVARAPTWVMNPTVAREGEFIAGQFARDPAWARGEFGAEWRDDIESFVSLDAVRSCVQAGVRERPFQQRYLYHGFVDVAGGSGADSYTFCIAHKEGSRVAIDATREVKPPFSPNDVTQELAALAKAYRLRTVKGDRFAGDWVVEAWRQHGIWFRHSEKSKSQLYQDLLPLVNAGQLLLLDDDRAINQIAGLERRVKFGSRSETIDHPERGHDDVANVIAGAAVHAFGSRSAPGSNIDDVYWKAPKVVLGYAEVKGPSRLLSGRRRRQPATADELCTLRIAKTHVGPHGHWYQPHGAPAGDGRQRYAICNSDGDILAFAWEREEAERVALDIADGLQVAAQ